MVSVCALALSGLVLVFLEFFLPGAIMGIGGAILLLASLFVFYMSYEGIFPFLGYLCALAGAVCLMARIAIARIKSAPSEGTLFLRSDQEGFQACAYPKEWVGKIGIAATDLKPSGHVLLEGKSVQAVSQADYIDKGTLVQVLGGQGGHIIVKSISEGV